MTDKKIVLTTTGTREEAGKIARALVERRLAACVNVVAIESVYRWKEAVESAQEWLLLVKTTAAASDQVQRSHPRAAFLRAAGMRRAARSRAEARSTWSGLGRASTLSNLAIEERAESCAYNFAEFVRRSSSACRYSLTLASRREW